MAFATTFVKLEWQRKNLALWDETLCCAITGLLPGCPAGKACRRDGQASLRRPGEIGESARVIEAYEDPIMGSTSLEGVVLRYGFFYGPGTWYRPGGAIAEQARKGEASIIGEGNAVWSFVHIDDAIAVTAASLTAEPGVYNVVDDDPLPVAK